jgi:amidase
MNVMSSPAAADIAEAVRSGRITARAAVETTLVRIKARDGELGAFQVVRAEAALREADEIDARADKADLPLAGVPIPIKDNVPVAGEPMRDGSAGSDAAPQPKDHEIVVRLRAAGAVVVGMTTVPELCCFGATDSSFGTTRNPWNLQRTPGGSSGGAAAAVASGMVAAAHGNDGMGSIRIPAACCGLVGIKAGLGVVPADLGNGSWFDMSENGPLAATVQDCALVLGVLADRPALALVGEPGRLRIGVSTRSPLQEFPVSKPWAGAAQGVAALLREAGHTVRQDNPKYGQHISTSGIVRGLAGVELDAQLLVDRSRLEPRTRRHAALGRLALAAGFPKESGRETWRAKADLYFADHDVLLTPTLAQSPPTSARWSERGWLRNVIVGARYAPFAAPWNLAGWPAMAVPAGVGPDGMPLSVQLVARPGGEGMLLALAGQIERLQPWSRYAPNYR